MSLNLALSSACDLTFKRIEKLRWMDWSSIEISPPWEKFQGDHRKDAELSSELMHSTPLSLVHMLGNNCHLSSNKLFSLQTFTYAGIFSRKILLCILCFWKVQLWEKSTKCPGVAKLEKLWKCCAGNWNFGPDGWMRAEKYTDTWKNIQSSVNSNC